MADRTEVTRSSGKDDPPAILDQIETLVGTVSDEAKKQLQTLIDQVAEDARQAYERSLTTAGAAASQGQDLLKQALDQGERLYESGREDVEHYVKQEPVISLLIAGAIGFGLGCIVFAPRR